MAEALQVLRMAPEEIFQQSEEQRARTLGIVQYGVTEVVADLRQLGIPVIAIQLRPLAEPVGICEVWRSQLPTQGGRMGGIHWRSNASVTFMAVDQDPMELPLTRATEASYRALFAVMDRKKHHLLRVWNYIADIHDDGEGLERYRQFNIGRQQAYLASHRSPSDESVPAASALGGSEAKNLSLFALSSRSRPLAIENPRQISAYHYPAEYGPRPPTFSRASLVDLAGPALFISGTASIVGHQSVHLGDCRAQTRETLGNIQVLLDEAYRQHGARWALRDLQFKVYLRHREDFSLVRAEMERIIGASYNGFFLQADICRRELLIEIEALALPLDNP